MYVEGMNWEFNGGESPGDSPDYSDDPDAPPAPDIGAMASVTRVQFGNRE
jgi:hypothetical protein